MSKISNIFSMISLLSDGRKYSVKELSEKLEVSERMIRVYKEELDKTGIYIDTIMGPYGGYVLNNNIKLPIIKFKEEDYKILDYYIEKEKDESKKKNLIDLREKIKGQYIEENVSTNKEEVLNTYNILSRAIKEKRKVRITYLSYGKGLNERDICPAEMMLFKNGWYCVAFCLVKQDIRQFELTRIKEIELLDEFF